MPNTQSKSIEDVCMPNVATAGSNSDGSLNKISKQFRQIRKKKSLKAAKRSEHSDHYGGGITIKEIFNTMFKEEASAKQVVLKAFDAISAIPDNGPMCTTSKPHQNRYTDIPCIERSRVILVNTRTGNNYIHANYASGYRQSKAYICCQGPKPETAEDFWHMIWQEKVFVISMLTKCMEDFRMKCMQYWPASEKDTLIFGEYKIRCMGPKKIQKTHESTMMCITKIISGSNKDEEVRPLVHLLFHCWPDYGIPDECVSFLGYTDTIRRVQREFMVRSIKKKTFVWKGHALGPPIVVHCSAGVGRTGTFCAVDICCRKLFHSRKVDIENVVRRIRNQRAQSIQTPEQLYFVYACVTIFAIQIKQLGATTEEREALIKTVQNATLFVKSTLDESVCKI